jgi:hypothetical protein
MSPDVATRVKIIQLRDLLGTMKVPHFRAQEMNKENLMWLSRNIHINNSDHTGLPDALRLVKEILNKSQ